MTINRLISRQTSRQRVPRRPPKADYRPEDLQHLSDMDHVRKRPAMYIGDVTARGLHHLVYEVVDNSIDEAMAGFAKHIKVTVNADGSVTVEDDGRGIPVEPHEQLSKELGREVSTLEGVMTVLKFGGKFEKGAYQTSGGLHGVGVTVVNFLSQWCEVEVSRDGHVYQQEYERGIPPGPVQRVGTTQEGGHQDDVQTRRHDLSNDQVQLRPALQAVAGTGFPQQRRAHRVFRRTRRIKANSFCMSGASSSSSSI